MHASWAGLTRVICGRPTAGRLRPKLGTLRARRMRAACASRNRKEFDFFVEIAAPPRGASRALALAPWRRARSRAPADGVVPCRPRRATWCRLVWFPRPTALSVGPRTRKLVWSRNHHTPVTRPVCAIACRASVLTLSLKVRHLRYGPITTNIWAVSTRYRSQLAVFTTYSLPANNDLM